jgi:hypothetical protein
MSRWPERFHLWRAVAYAVWGGWVLVFAPTLRESITVLFVLSVVACVEGALTNWSARRAERVAAETSQDEAASPSSSPLPSSTTCTQVKVVLHFVT